jgi:N-methylhydantoinase A
LVLVAVDIGGTFTDVVVVDAKSGAYHTVKVPTTPHRLVEGVSRGALAALQLAGATPDDVERFVHGTTIGTNAILERGGATTAVLATAGFEDSLEIGRLKRTRMYDLFMDAETPAFLAPRRLRRGIPERLAADGSVVTELDEQATARAVRELRDQEGASAFAVCLLFSFRNSVHERRVREIIHEVDPALSVSLSHEIDPMFREYERTVVTAFDAYIRPVIQQYVSDLSDELKRAGITAPLQIMQSRGGITSAGLVTKRPVSVLLSGPAAGVIGGKYAGELSGITDLITIDVGGTSADISLVQAGKPLVTNDGMIDTYPLRVPMVDVVAIGAGGGSVAWVDAAGNFRVGPRSAGAEPGPACYGRGGHEATVTDASVVLGYLNPDFFAGGTLPLDPEAARHALDQFGSKLGLSAVDAASGVHGVINSKMADAIRLISIRRGYDARDFALVLLGGAGPIHGGRLAEQLSITKMVVPAVPGVLSALGLLVASIEHDHAETIATRSELASPADLEAAFLRLEDTVAARMHADQVPVGEAATLRSVDGRYVGQGYTLEIPIGRPVTLDSLAVYREEFHAAHERIYGHANRGASVELVNARVVQSWSLPRIALHPGKPGSHTSNTSSRRAHFDELGGYSEVPVFRRDQLRAGDTITGPALVEQPDTTLVVYPGHRAELDAAGNIIVTVPGAGSGREA